MIGLTFAERQKTTNLDVDLICNRIYTIHAFESDLNCFIGNTSGKTWRMNSSINRQKNSTLVHWIAPVRDEHIPVTPGEKCVLREVMEETKCLKAEVFEVPDKTWKDNAMKWTRSQKVGTNKI